MKNWKKYYLAGLWDGDGSFGISKRENYNQNPNSKNKWTTYQPHALLTLCDPKAIQVFKIIEEEFGFKCVWSSRRDNPKWKMQYRYLLSSQKACDFAKLLEPYLIIKKERAKLMIQFPRKYRTMPPKERAKTSAKQIELYEQMKILNKRGT